MQGASQAAVLRRCVKQHAAPTLFMVTWQPLATLGKPLLFASSSAIIAFAVLAAVLCCGTSAGGTSLQAELMPGAAA